jgi:hypothetical protein
MFVDSQNQDTSGIVEIDLNKDSAPEKIISMKDLRNEYQKSAGHLEGLREFGGSDKDTFRGQIAIKNAAERAAKEAGERAKKEKPLTPEEQAKLLADLMGSVKGADW